MTKSEQTRDNILSVSLELFSEKGFDGTGMRDVAKKAGVSLGLTYNYFNSKEALLTEIILDHSRKIKDWFISKYQETDSPDKAKDMLIENYLEILQGNEEYFRLFWSLMLQPKILKDQEALITGMFEMIYESFTKIPSKQKSGFTDIDRKHMMILILGSTINYLVKKDLFPIDTLREILKAKAGDL